MMIMANYELFSHLRTSSSRLFLTIVYMSLFRPRSGFHPDEPIISAYPGSFPHYFVSDCQVVTVLVTDLSRKFNVLFGLNHGYTLLWLVARTHVATVAPDARWSEPQNGSYYR